MRLDGQGLRGAPPHGPGLVIPGRADEAVPRLAAAGLAGSAAAVLVTCPQGGGGLGPVEDLRRYSRGGRAIVLRVRCAPGDRGSEFSAITELFSSILSPRTRELLSFSPQGDLYAVFRALYVDFAELLKSAPVAIAVDDVQWCDRSSLRVLDFVLRRADELPLFLLLTRRPDRSGPGADILAAIAAQSRCVVLPGGSAQQPEDTDAPAPAGDPVADSWGGQASHLGTVAAAVSVLDTTETALVSAVCGLPRHSVETAIGFLRTHRLLPGGLSGPGAMPVLRTAMSSAALGALHLRAARVLSDVARPAGEIARHLLALPELPDPWMLDMLVEAAGEAVQAGEHDAAVRYLTRAVAAEPGRLAVRLALADALTASDPEAAVGQLREASRHADDLPSRCRIAAKFAAAAAGTGAGPEAVQLLAAVLRELDAAPRPVASPSRAVLLAALTEAAANGTVALNLVRRRLGNEVEADEEASPTGMLAARALVAAMDAENPSFAAELARGVLSRQQAAPDGRTALTAARVLQLTGDVESTVRALDIAVAVGLRRADRRTWGQALALRSLMHQESGNLTDAVTDARTVLWCTEDGVAGPATVLARIALAGVQRGEGDFEAAEKTLDELDHARLQGTIWEHHLYLMGVAAARVHAGDPEAALERLRECGRGLTEAGIRNPVFSAWWFEGALILADLGRAGEALELAEQGAEQARTWATPLAEGMVLLARGAAASETDAVELLEEASRVLCGSPSQVKYARSEYALGRTLLRLGDRDGARRHLREAMVVSARTGRRALGSAARDLFGDAGGRLRRELSGADVLTQRERHVAELVAGGASNRDVAEQLFIRPRTVELHLTNVYRKLGVGRRSELATALEADTLALGAGGDGRLGRAG